MARPSMQGMTIARLESMLNQQRSKKKELLRERIKLQTQLEKLDRQIAGLDGGGGGGGGSGAGYTSGGRARNEKSLVAVLEDVLEKHPKGLGVGEIVDAVQAAGYKSGSPNFRGIVNQTLIKEKKRFGAVSRGIYSLKK